MQDNNDKAKRKQVRESIDYAEKLGISVMCIGFGAMLANYAPGISLLETKPAWGLPVMLGGWAVVFVLRIWMGFNKEKWQEPEEKNETK